MEHPIHDLLNISLNNIKDMIDVNTVVGNAITHESGKVIIPVSTVKFGFASGGTDMKNHQKSIDNPMPFGGGTGGNVSISPTAFLVLHNDKVELLSLNDNTHIYETLIKKTPEALGKVKDLISNKKSNKSNIDFK